MTEPEVRRASALVVVGPGAQDDVLNHTLRVLSHYEIPFEVVEWDRLTDRLATGGPPRLGVIVFETAFAYTDEHLRLPEGVLAPVLRVITDSAPPPGQVLTETTFMATTGFGVAGAVNAGLLAARILALADDVLANLLATNPYQVP
jgi:hypothetical protein